MERVPDNYDMFEAHEARIYAEVRHRPVCGWCENPIMEDYGYRIEGDLVCPGCARDWLADMRERIEEDY